MIHDKSKVFQQFDIDLCRAIHGDCWNRRSWCTIQCFMASNGDMWAEYEGKTFDFTDTTDFGDILAFACDVEGVPTFGRYLYVWTCDKVVAAGYSDHIWCAKNYSDAPNICHVR